MDDDRQSGEDKDINHRSGQEVAIEDWHQEPHTQEEDQAPNSTGDTAADKIGECFKVAILAQEQCQRTEANKCLAAIGTEKLTNKSSIQGKKHDTQQCTPKGQQSSFFTHSYQPF